MMRQIGLALSALLMVAVGKAEADGVLVFGATGQLGAPHVRMLLEQGEKVIVFHRPSSSFERLAGLDYETVEGDLLDGASVLAAMERTKPRVVIDTSARRGSRMRAGQSFYTPAMQNIVAAAQATDVQQIIIHSSIGVRGSAAFLEEEYGYDTNSPNMLDKAQAEVELEESGINYTIVRNGLLDYEPAPATGRGQFTEDQNSFGRITRTDLARITLECLDNPECFGKIYHALDEGLTGPRPSRQGGE